MRRVTSGESEQSLDTDDHADVIALLGVDRERSALPTGLEAWSARTIVATRPLLAARARGAYRRRVGRALAIGMLPLPVVVAYARVLFRWLHQALAALLPTPLPELAVAGYATTALLVLALTYAAIPVLVERTMRLGAWLPGD